jgi:hypothetical protein
LMTLTKQNNFLKQSAKTDTKRQFKWPKFESILNLITFQNKKHQAKMGSLVNPTMYLPHTEVQRVVLTHSLRLASLYYQNQMIFYKKNYWSMSLMNIGTKPLNEILRNQMQQHIKRIMHHNHSSQLCKSDLIFKTN